MRPKQYPQWNSQFYDSVFANPAPDPLKDLKEVSNTTTVLGSSAILSIKSLKASCSAIVKLSQEGSTYYSSIRDTSSASGSYQYQPPVLTSDAKVSSWFTDHVGSPSQPNGDTAAIPPPPVPSTPQRTSSTVPSEHARPPRTSSTVPDAQIPQSSSLGDNGVRGSNVASSSRGKQPMTRPPRPPSVPPPSESATVPPQSLQIHDDPITKSGGEETAAPPRRPHNSFSTTPVTPSSRVARNRVLLSDQDRDIIRGLKDYVVPVNQTKIFIKNVPTTPNIKQEVKALLLKHVEQVHDIEHVDIMITAITDKKGSKEFREEHDGTVLGASNELLIIVLVD